MTALQEAVLWLTVLTAPNHHRAWVNPWTLDCHVVRAWEDSRYIGSLHQGVERRTYFWNGRFEQPAWRTETLDVIEAE
jgi:hypothetical protein